MERAHELISLRREDRAEKCSREQATRARDSTVET
jgi:hypothetical protein